MKVCRVLDVMISGFRSLGFCFGAVRRGEIGA